MRGGDAAGQAAPAAVGTGQADVAAAEGVVAVAGGGGVVAAPAWAAAAAAAAAAAPAGGKDDEAAGDVPVGAVQWRHKHECRRYHRRLVKRAVHEQGLASTSFRMKKKQQVIAVKYTNQRSGHNRTTEGCRHRVH